MRLQKPPEILDPSKIAVVQRASNLKQSQARLVGQTTSTEVITALQAEVPVALAGTIFVAALVILKAFRAGPLWRDEVTSINIAQMPSLPALWHYLRFESFPALWILVLRGWSSLGLANSDLGIRMLGLLIGLCFLGSLWICNRWMKGRAPLVSLAVLGSVPTMINIVGANRAYGLALCLLVLCFGAIWRLVESPSKHSVALAGIFSILFVHCVYYDAVFLSAMLLGAALVTIQQRKWRVLVTLGCIGSIAGASMAIYLPIIRSESQYVSIVQVPFDLGEVWAKIAEAAGTPSSGHHVGGHGQEIWLWVLLILTGAITAGVTQLRNAHEGSSNQRVGANISSVTERVLFGGITMLSGTTAYLCFLAKLRYTTQTWYYAELFALVAISLDAIFGGVCPPTRLWSFARVAFVVMVMTWGASSVWEEAHTRSSNVDLIAATLKKQESPSDLIIVNGAFEGVTFNRYYHGEARWMSVPPVGSFQVQRLDLVWEALEQHDPMAPILSEIRSTLEKGARVWVVGQMVSVQASEKPRLLPPLPILKAKWWLGRYNYYWSSQLTASLIDQAGLGEPILLQSFQPISGVENLPVILYSATSLRANRIQE